MIQFRRADARFAQRLQLECCLHSRLIVIFRLRGFQQVDCCHHVCSICQFFAKNLILKVCIRYLDATQVAWIFFLLGCYAQLFYMVLIFPTVAWVHDTNNNQYFCCIQVATSTGKNHPSVTRLSGCFPTQETSKSGCYSREGWVRDGARGGCHWHRGGATTTGGVPGTGGRGGRDSWANWDRSTDGLVHFSSGVSLVC